MGLKDVRLKPRHPAGSFKAQLPVASPTLVRFCMSQRLHDPLPAGPKLTSPPQKMKYISGADYMHLVFQFIFGENTFVPASFHFKHQNKVT
ncbi:hypothetical protein ACA30_06315 [Virgibacillus soli]|nr:hypothetical protein ACA30_06315 [Virgibacillus soli]